MNFDIFASPIFQENMFFLKIIFIILFFLFIGGIILFLLKSQWFRNIFWEDWIEIVTFKAFKENKAARAWDKIIERFDTGSPSEQKLSVVKADTLLNEVLGDMGYLGERLDERIKKVPADLMTHISIEEIMGAHRICSDIVYDPDYRIESVRVKEILDIYEKILKDLQAL